MPIKHTTNRQARKRASNDNSNASSNDAAWGASGDAAQADMKRAQAEAAANRTKGYQPLRFYLKNNNESEIVILDDTLHSFMGNEHHLKHANGKWGNFQSCCNQFAHCAICENLPDHPSYRVLLLTVLVRKPWTDKRGNEHQYSRMLLPIKQGQHERFIELERIAQKNAPGKSLRGTALRMKRGSDKQSINIGEPSAFDDGNLLDYFTDDELVTEFGHDEVLNRDGEVIVKENGYLDVFDYMEMFPKPDPDKIAELYGNGASVGSVRDRDDAFGDEGGKEEEREDEVPMVHSFSEKGAACDDNATAEDDAIKFEEQLAEAAEKHELNPDEFPTWKALGDEIDAKDAKPKTRATKKVSKNSAVRTRTRRKKSDKEPFD